MGPLELPASGVALGSAEGETEGDTEGDTDGEADGDGDVEGEGEGPAMWSEPPLQVSGALPCSYQPVAVSKQLGPANFPLLRQKVA